MFDFFFWCYFGGLQWISDLLSLADTLIVLLSPYKPSPVLTDYNFLMFMYALFALALSVLSLKGLGMLINKVLPVPIRQI